MKKYFIVRVDLPESFTIPEMTQLIREDIGSWQGGMHPEDKIQDFDRKSVRVRSIGKRNTQIIQELLNYTI